MRHFDHSAMATVNHSHSLINIALVLLQFTANAYAQGTRDDYERSEKLRTRVQGKVFKSSIESHWFAEGNKFWYRN